MKNPQTRLRWGVNQNGADWSRQLQYPFISGRQRLPAQTIVRKPMVSEKRPDIKKKQT
jgi:hypothetical protein